MKETSIPYFTPSMCEPALLEAMFVGPSRKRLLSRLLERTRDSSTSRNRHYSLVLGPRGIGKTHLMSLLYYRLKEEVAITPLLLTAWLHEDPYEISSYAGLLSAILNQLNDDYGIPDWVQRSAEINNLAMVSHKETALEQAILDYVSPRALLLIAENLDEIFLGLGDDGQKSLRAFLEAKGLITMVATSTTLISDFKHRERPFFGFFKKERLDPLTFDDCIEALVHIAQYMDNHDLIKVLQTAQGRGRVRAIHHLAGGNPRIYTMFYQFLSRESLDQLAGPFMDLVNELTPYYQSRMQSLSPRQRTLVNVIRKHESPIALQEVVRLAYADPEGSAKDLKKLVELGYIDSKDVGGDRLYELREPLMRICLSVKELRGRPLRLFVDFLRIWFSPSELQNLGLRLPTQLSDYALYKDAIEESRRQYDELLDFEHKKVNEAIAGGRTDMAVARLQLLCERAPSDLWAWYNLRGMLASTKQYPELIAISLERTRLFPEEGLAWNDLNYAWSLVERYDAARLASERAIEHSPDEPIFWQNHLTSLQATGATEELSSAALAVLNLKENTSNAAYYSVRAQSLQILGRGEEAVRSWLKSLALQRDNYAVWRGLHVSLESLDAAFSRESVASFATSRFPQNEMAWRDYATALVASGRFRDALYAHDKALVLSPESNELRKERLRYLIYSNRLEEASIEVRWYESLGQATPDGSFTLSLVFYYMASKNKARAKELLHQFVVSAVVDRSLGQHKGPAAIVSWIKEPEGWTEYIKLWIEVFRAEGAITALGSAIVKGALWIAGIESQTLLDKWIESWTAEGQEVADLVVGLRLIQAAAGAIRSGSTALLDLPVEQRTLLEPELERHLRIRGGLSQTLDEEVVAFLRDQHRLSESGKDEKSAASDWAHGVNWQSYKLDSSRRQELLSEYGASEPPNSRVRRLLPGNYGMVPPERVADLLDLIARERSGVAALAFRPGLRILRIEEGDLALGSGHIYQVTVRVDDVIGAIDVWADKDWAVLLDGTSMPMDKLVKGRAFTILPETELTYIVLFCSALRAERGRFEIVLPDTQTFNEVQEMGVAIDLLSTEDRTRGEHTYELPLVYGKTLFRTVLRVDPQGSVEMVEDTNLDIQLQLKAEAYDGPIRFVSDT